MGENGDRPPTADEVDYRLLASELAQQIGALTAEVIARGQIIDRLRGELAQCRQTDVPTEIPAAT